MKVLHVAQPVDGGVAAVVLALTADQVARGWTVTVAGPSAGTLPQAVRRSGGQHRAWSASRGAGLKLPAQCARLARLIRQENPDVLHLHSSTAGLVGRLVTRGRVPTLFQPHAWSWWAASGVMLSATVAWERAAAGWTDCVIAVSEAERENGVARGVQARFEVIPNGVEISPTVPAQWSARQDLGLQERPTAVCVGRLALQKDPEMAVRAWPLVLRRVENACLVLVGTGPLEAHLREIAARLDLTRAVIFAGPQEHGARWFAAGDVAVLTSRWEGMALTVLEAQAAGRPVVATDVGGVRESLAPGVGAVVPIGDHEAFAHAVSLLLADPGRARAEGLRARAYAVRHFDVRRAVDATASISARVLRESTITGT